MYMNMDMMSMSMNMNSTTSTAWLWLRLWLWLWRYVRTTMSIVSILNSNRTEQAGLCWVGGSCGFFFPLHPFISALFLFLILFHGTSLTRPRSYAMLWYVIDTTWCDMISHLLSNQCLAFQLCLSPPVLEILVIGPVHLWSSDPFPPDSDSLISTSHPLISRFYSAFLSFLFERGDIYINDTTLLYLGLSRYIGLCMNTISIKWIMELATLRIYLLVRVMCIVLQRNGEQGRKKRVSWFVA